MDRDDAFAKYTTSSNILGIDIGLQAC